MRVRLPILTFLFIILTAGGSLAQRTLGVKWDVPESDREALAELQIFRELNIRYLEVGTPLPEAAWDTLRASGMRVWAAMPISYPTRLTFALPDSMAIRSLEQFLPEFIHREPVTAIRLFRYGAVHDSRFFEALSPWLDQIRSSYNGDLYHLRSRTAGEENSGPLDFAMQDLPVRAGYEGDGELQPDPDAGAWLYRPDEEMAPYLGPFKELLDATASQPGTPLFVTSDWLLRSVNRHASFAETLRLYATRGNTVFPLPEESYPREDPIGLGVLLLFLLWGSVALHYSLNPIYRRSVKRFFISHRFYVNDVLHRHVRAPAQGIVMLLQHAALTGILLYCLGSYLLTPTGMEALVNHLPLIEFFGGAYFSLFCWGFLASLLLECIAILWLLLLNGRVKYFSQVTNLYNWPLQANLVTVTVLFALLISRPGGGHFAASLFLGIFLLLFLGSFLLTAFDTSKLLTKKRPRFLLSTAGLYILLLVGGIGWLLSKTDILAVISLALNV